jgi:hypothetical protein
VRPPGRTAFFFARLSHALDPDRAIDRGNIHPIAAKSTPSQFDVEGPFIPEVPRNVRAIAVRLPPDLAVIEFDE